MNDNTSTVIIVSLLVMLGLAIVGAIGYYSDRSNKTQQESDMARQQSCVTMCAEKGVLMYTASQECVCRP
jgi:hypothetical protein